MELGTQDHGVDHDRLLLWVIVEDHNLEEPTRAVRANDEIPPVAGDDSYGVSDGVPHVFVEDAVLASAVGDLHHDKVALSGPRVKVTLSTAGSVGIPCETPERENRVPNYVPNLAILTDSNLR
jgi:hypothetical protein